MWVLLILFGIAILFLLLVWAKSRKRGLPAGKRAHLQTELTKASNIQDLNRRVIDCEKVIDHALQSLGFTGTFADKLKRAGPRFSDIESIWRAHKLRNRLAHEVGVHLDEREAMSAVNAFRKALEEL